MRRWIVLLVTVLSTISLMGCDDSNSGFGGKGDGTSSDKSSILYHGDISIETLPLTSFDSVTQEQLDQATTSSGMRLFIETEATRLAENKKTGILLDYIGELSWAQTILAKRLNTPVNGSVTEELMIDPTTQPLTAYDGIRFWVDVKRPAGKETMNLEFIFFMGHWTTYRVMYQYSVFLPEGDYTGYITVPFNEMVSGYDTDTKMCDKENIDYFAFKLVASRAQVAGIQITVSDFSAYREVFWE